MARLLGLPRAELPAVAWGIGASGLTLASFMVVKPLREAIGIAGGLADLPWLFTGTWIVTLALIPAQLLVVRRFPGARSFSALALASAGVQLAFFAGLLTDSGAFPLRVAFFLWVSVFNLFVVSALWSCFASAWPGTRAARTFGVLASGGSVAAIASPLLAGGIAGRANPVVLLAVSAASLLGAIVCVRRMLAAAAMVDAHDHPRPGTPSAVVGPDDITPLEGLCPPVGEAHRPRGTMPPQPAGPRVRERERVALTRALALLVRSPWLRRTALFALSTATLATFFYAEQGRIVQAASGSLGERTRLFANVDLVGNVLACALQLVAASRLIARIGAGATLTIMPAVAAVGAGVMLMVPTANTLAACEGARRGATHGLARPARESLFGSVDTDARWGSKLIIDTVVVRTADAGAIWCHFGLVAMAGPATGLVAIVPLALLTALLGWSLDLRRVAAEDPARAE